MSGGSRKGSESEEGAAACPLVVPRHLCLGVPSQPCSPPGWLWLRRGTGLGSGRRPMGSWHRSLFWLSEAVSACSCSVCVLPLPLPCFSSGSVLMACTHGTPSSCFQHGDQCLSWRTFLWGWFLGEHSVPLSCGPGGAQWLWPCARA